jgi:hypothetical protein
LLCGILVSIWDALETILALVVGVWDLGKVAGDKQVIGSAIDADAGV